MMFYCLRAKFLILFQCKPRMGGDGPYGKGIINNAKTVTPTHVGMDR